VIYLCIFNGADLLIVGIAWAGLVHRSLESLVSERNGAQQAVSERRVHGVWAACRHTAALHARAGHRATGLNALWTMDVL
jgi:hypothetical protein